MRGAGAIGRIERVIDFDETFLDLLEVFVQAVLKNFADFRVGQVAGQAAGEMPEQIVVTGLIYSLAYQF